MKCVLISIQPKWCELIASGKKTVEVRKTKPKIETPFKCYIYCTKSKNQFLQSRSNMRFYCENKDFIGGHGAGVYQRLNGKVIGEFICDEIFPIRVFENGLIQDYMCHSTDRSCVPYDDISSYIGKDKTGYGWHISDLVIYDKPKELSEFWNVKCSNKNGCSNCYIKPNCITHITRPPQSWCYVDG